MTIYRWKDLLENPQHVAEEGGRVSLESQLIKTKMEKTDDNPGVEIIISPHPNKSGLNSSSDYLDSQIIAFLPGRFSKDELQSLQSIRINCTCLYIEGRFEYKPGNQYLGQIVAESWSE